MLPPLKKTHIFHLAKPPLDLDKVIKLFVKKSGIDPLEYEGVTKFNIPHDIFYKMLFSYRKADSPDANLLFFLTDFTTKKKVEMHGILNGDYVMGMAAEEPERVLETKFELDEDLEDFNGE